jgi:hypothetical protein
MLKNMVLCGCAINRSLWFSFFRKTVGCTVVFTWTNIFLLFNMEKKKIKRLNFFKGFVAANHSF